MAKDYVFHFGTADARTYTGLSPTFIIFKTISDGSSPTAPSIAEVGTSTGFYRFSYGPTVGIVFEIDGGAGITTDSDRYVKGSLDPVQAVDERVGGILANNDSFGSTSADPSTIVGFLKRLQELIEGNATFNKSTQEWLIYSRGSSTLLRSKTLANTTSQATKT